MTYDFKRAIQVTGAPAADDPPETREILAILPHASAASFFLFVMDCWPAPIRTLAQSRTHSLVLVRGFGGGPKPFSTAKHIEQYLMACDAIYVTQQPGTPAP